MTNNKYCTIDDDQFEHLGKEYEVLSCVVDLNSTGTRMKLKDAEGDVTTVVVPYQSITWIQRSQI